MANDRSHDRLEFRRRGATRSKNFAVEVVIPLDKPVTVTDRTVIKFKYHVTKASKVGYGFEGTNPAGDALEVNALKVGYTEKKWNELSAKLAGLRSATGPAGVGSTINKLHFHAGFKGERPTFYIDEIVILDE